MFKETEVINKINNRGRLVHGVGINDVNYIISKRENLKHVLCPFYTVWSHMLKRCYCKPYHIKYPTYNECTVSKEWLVFSVFKEWMIRQDWRGKELDKDIIKPGNKHYSPGTCAFINGHVNRLLGNHAAKRGNYSQGVYLRKDTNKFSASCHVHGKQKPLGCYFTEQEASEVYKKAKHKEILRVADLQSDTRVRDGLYRHAELILI